MKLTGKDIIQAVIEGKDLLLWIQTLSDEMSSLEPVEPCGWKRRYIGGYPK